MNGTSVSVWLKDSTPDTRAAEAMIEALLATVPAFTALNVAISALRT